MQWSPSHSWSYYAVLALGVGMALVLARRFATVSSARSALLLGLRGAVLSALIFILLEPVRITLTRPPARAPRAVYLIDDSLSMSLEKPTSRLDQARQTITAAEELLTTRNKPAIELYGFGEKVRAVENTETLTARARETRLSEALAQVASRVDGDLPTGIFLFSDGRSTESGALARLAQAFGRLDVPIHVIPVGRPQGAADVAIQSLVAPREARFATKVPVRVVVRSQGFAGERAELRIRSLAKSSGRPLASVPLGLVDGEVASELVLDSDQATGPLVVEVPPLRDETLLENNRIPFEVGRRNAKIRVIYMEGTTPNEYQYLRDALVSDPNIDCLAMETDVQSNVAPRLHRVDDFTRGYPTTREELFSYDVVICSDISRRAFTAEQLDWTVDLVAKRGGGFVMVGGYTSFGAGRWDETSWDGMIPVDMSGSPTGGDGTVNDVKLRVQIPPDALDHPIWHMVDDPAKNREILAKMPPFFGTNLTDRLKPAATVLGLASLAALTAREQERILPDRRARAGALPRERYLRAMADRGQTLIPVFTCQPYGKGRTFAFSSDTTFGWGRDFETLWGEGDNRYFRKFWRNVVTWLAENSVNAHRRLVVQTDKLLYHPGESIRVSARTIDEHFEPVRTAQLVAAFAEPEIDSEAPTQRSKSMRHGTSDGTCEAELIVPPLSSWPSRASGESGAVHKLAIRVTALDGKRIVETSDVDVQVVDDPLEYRELRPDHGLLARIARESGGRVLADARELAETLASDHTKPGETLTRRSPLWANPAVLLLLIGLLTAEWIVRRTMGLA